MTLDPFESGMLQALATPLSWILAAVAVPFERFRLDVVPFWDKTLFQLATGKAPATSVGRRSYGPGRWAGEFVPAPLKLTLMTCAGNVAANNRVKADASQVAEADRESAMGVTAGDSVPARRVGRRCEGSDQ